MSQNLQNIILGAVALILIGVGVYLFVSGGVTFGLTAEEQAELQAEANKFTNLLRELNTIDIESPLLEDGSAFLQLRSYNVEVFERPFGRERFFWPYELETFGSEPLSSAPTQ